MTRFIAIGVLALIPAVASAQGVSSAEAEAYQAFQALSPEERSWVLENPDSVRQLGEVPTEQRSKFLELYGDLSAEDKARLRENADEIGKMSAEERAWALENPDAVRQLGDMHPEDRDRAIETYRSLPPDLQKRVLGGGGGFR